MKNDDLLAAKEAAYWLADYANFLSKLAANHDVHAFKECITQIPSPNEPKPDDPRETIDFCELFRGYEAKIVSVLAQIPSIFDSPPSFGNSSPAASLHAAVLEYGRTLKWKIQCCYHVIVAIEEMSPDGQEFRCHEELDSEAYLSRKSRLVDDRVRQLMKELRENPAPPASTADYHLNREYQAARSNLALHLALADAGSVVEENLVVPGNLEVGEDGPVAPDGFAWRGETVTGFSRKQFSFLQTVWNGNYHSVSFDELAKSVYGENEEMSISGAKGFQSKINLRLPSSIPWRISLTTVPASRASFVRTVEN